MDANDQTVELRAMITRAEAMATTVTATLLQDEIESLRAQVEELTAGAIVRANRQAILVEENARLRAQLLSAHALIGVMSDPAFDEVQR